MKLASLVLFISSVTITTAISIADWLIPHNTYRCMHGVPLLEWDSCLAASAQSWADKGTFTHSSSYTLTGCEGPAGENLAIGHSTAYNAITAWYSEVTTWEKSPKNGNNASGAGHFTVMIWKGAKKLGCGYDPKTKIYVCRYKGGDSLAAKCDVPNMQGCFTTQNIPSASTAASRSKNMCEIQARINAGLDPNTTTSSTTKSATSSSSSTTSTTTNGGTIPDPNVDDNPDVTSTTTSASVQTSSLVNNIFKWVINFVTNGKWKNSSLFQVERVVLPDDADWNTFDIDNSDAPPQIRMSSASDTDSYVPGIFTDNGILDNQYYDKSLSPILDRLKKRYAKKDDYILKAYESRFNLIKAEQNAINSLAVTKGAVTPQKSGSKIMDRIVIKVADKLISSSLMDLLIGNVKKYLKQVIFDFLTQAEQVDFKELFTTILTNLIPASVNQNSMIWIMIKTNVASMLDALIRALLDTLLPFFTTSNVETMAAKAASFVEAIVTVAVRGDSKARTVLLQHATENKIYMNTPPKTTYIDDNWNIIQPGDFGTKSFSTSMAESESLGEKLFLHPDQDELAKAIMFEKELMDKLAADKLLNAEQSRRQVLQDNFATFDENKPDTIFSGLQTNKFMNLASYSFIQLRKTIGKHFGMSSDNIEHQGQFMAASSIPSIKNHMQALADLNTDIVENIPLFNPYNWLPESQQSVPWRIPANVLIEKEGEIGSKAAENFINSASHLTNAAKVAEDLSITYSSLGDPILSLITKMFSSILSPTAFGGVFTSILFGLFKQIFGKLFSSDTSDSTSTSSIKSVETNINKNVKEGVESILTLFLPSKVSLNSIINDNSSDKRVKSSAYSLLQFKDNSNKDTLGENMLDSIIDAFLGNIGSEIKDKNARIKIRNNIADSLKLGTRSLCRTYLPEIKPSSLTNAFNNQFMLLAQTVIYSVTRTSELQDLFADEIDPNNTTTSSSTTTTSTRATTTTTTKGNDWPFDVPDFGF